MNHKIKTVKPFFQHVLDGIKTFELRENDRGYQAGDTLELVEVDELSIRTGRTAIYEVTYVLSGWNLGNRVILAIVPASTITTLDQNTKHRRDIVRRKRFCSIMREGKRTLKLPQNEREMIVELCDVMDAETKRMEEEK